MQGTGRPEFSSEHRNKLLRIYLFYGAPAFGQKVFSKEEAEAAGDITTSVNDIFKMFTKLNLLSPDLTPQRLQKNLIAVTNMPECMAQEHPNVRALF